MAVQTWDGRTRNIARTSFVTHAGVVLLAVGVFMGVSRAVNGDAAASGIDLRWYLGALEDRLDAAVWFDLLRDWLREHAEANGKNAKSVADEVLEELAADKSA